MAAMGNETVVDARRRLWTDAGFGVDGGYDEPWQEATFAGVPYAVPNSRIRADALRVHDVHHVLTGYGTDWRGESEIAAWELGSGGGGRFVYAWFIAVFGFVIGLLALPRRTFQAFRRGRVARNLYGHADPMSVLDRDVQEVRRALDISARRGPAWGDALAFAAWAFVTVPAGVLALLGTPVLVFAAFARCSSCPLTGRTSVSS
jgi:hypothetical protein